MATINIKNKVEGLNEILVLELIKAFFEQRAPKDGTFDYGLLSFGTFLDATFIDGQKLNKAIHVRQEGKRKNAKSPINIIIEYHQTIF